MSATMADLIHIKGRFARSVRADADGAADALDGYLPTGRSLDVVRRVARGLTRDDAARAFSITGPYGSGKSSLAVLLDAALSPAQSALHRSARRILGEESPELLSDLDAGRAACGAAESGFLRAVITAPQREPVVTTVLRALERGTRREGHQDLAHVARGMLERAESNRFSSPSFTELSQLLHRLCAQQPVLLVLDEFGKNLEAYADAGPDGDLYLLQEIAELTSGSGRLPLIVATIQHLAFESYAADASAAQRREWAKVQGRLEDIPFLDSPAATRRLIASALVHDPAADKRRGAAALKAAALATAMGAAEVSDPDLVGACWPLHPSVLLVLPDLCARYGQNERTLFSFLASEAPHSVRDQLQEVPSTGDMPWVRLDRVYDYFVESASTFVGASKDASRWIEIETTIRDAHGLTEAQRRVLKTIGVFNLVATVGTVRASTELLQFALAASGPGLHDTDEVAERLDELVCLGVVVHRDFAGEYRIWRGSDYDLEGAVLAARRRANERSQAELLSDVAPLPPLVAARHAIVNGTVRAFARVWADDRTRGLALPSPEGACDGLLVHVLATDPEGVRLPEDPRRIPVVTLSAEPTEVVTAALEVAALTDVSHDAALRGDDHAVHRELAERLGFARTVLQRAIAGTYGPQASWAWANPVDRWQPPSKRPIGTSLLSDVLDAAYPHPWSGDYEPINRAELSSAAAKARREVLSALVDPRRRQMKDLGLDGNGADIAVYRSVYGRTKLHSPKGIAEKPAVPYRPAWQTLMDELDDAVEAPVTATHLLDRLMLPPHGLRAGIAGMVLVAGLLHRSTDIAIYEHGTFKPRLDGALVDRLVRNPRNFAVKHLAAADARSTRGRIVAGLADALNTPAAVLPVTTALVRLLGARGKWIRTSRRLHLAWTSDADEQALEDVAAATAVRDAILNANEPDELLFNTLAKAFGYGAAEPGGTSSRQGMSRAVVDDFVTDVANAARVLAGAQTLLIEHVASSILRAATRGESLADLVASAERVSGIELAAADVRTFAGQALLAGYADTTAAWVTSLATACTGRPPADWTDADVRPLVAKLGRIASDFRRVAYLASAAREQAESPEPFTAWMLSATAPDGSHHDTVVALPARLATSARAAVEATACQLASEMSLDVEDAMELIIGAVAERMVASDDRVDYVSSDTLGRERPKLHRRGESEAQ